jgi:hypothetical protein
MANKRLLSLLFLISITNLFSTNAEVTTCYSGRFWEGERPRLTTETCPEYANYACFKEVLKFNDRNWLRYDCASESYCKEKGNGFKCCLNDICNIHKT